MSQIPEKELDIFDLELAITWTHAAALMDANPEVSYFFSLSETALKEKLERLKSVMPSNDPLTLEELREMDGEPVWTVTLSVEGSGRWELCTCEVVTACPLHKVLRCVTAVGAVTDYELDTYGNTWLAYRRKPERN